MSFRMAAKAASKSTFSQHRLGAVIAKGGRILSTGFNEIRYDKYLDKSTRHAEEAAIIRVLRNGNCHSLVGSDLFVTRFTPAGSIRLSKPCSRCLHLIRSVGIRRVYYSTDSGTESIKV